MVSKKNKERIISEKSQRFSSHEDITYVWVYDPKKLKNNWQPYSVNDRNKLIEQMIKIPPSIERNYDWEL